MPLNKPQLKTNHNKPAVHYQYSLGSHYPFCKHKRPNLYWNQRNALVLTIDKSKLTCLRCLRFLKQPKI